jgi:FtsP/CotA-like multicopper oxidase with cupredoxin domain
MTTSGGPRLSRRRLLTAAAGGAVLLADPGVFARRARAAALPFTRELPIPEVLSGRHIRLPIVEAEVPILPGAPTRMWTYAGHFPGPTIRRPAGHRTAVRFHHRLPASAGELSVHLHGGHTRSKDDGQPGGLTSRHPRSLYCDVPTALSARVSNNDVLIRPGASRTYHYDLTEDGRPERGATRWYHDHRLDNTGRNVWRGLAGMWITDGPDEQALPSGDREIPLIIGDRSFDKSNQLTNPFRLGGHAPFDQVTGSVVLVNGAHLPFHRVEAKHYRLRVLNASNFRAYALTLGAGVPIVQIGTDSGLLPQPVPRGRVVIGPGERVDLIVDFARAAHRSVELRSDTRPGAPNKLGSKTWVGPLMRFDVGARGGPDRTRIPDGRPLPAWTAAVPGHVSHEWRITVGGGFAPGWLINGRAYNPAHVDHRAKLGTVERWRVVNATQVAHLFHLHHTDWLLLSRNGRRPPAYERGLKETFYLDPGDHIEVAGRFSDYTGRYVVHCHMLEHEDHGLMSQFATYA